MIRHRTRDRNIIFITALLAIVAVSCGVSSFTTSASDFRVDTITDGLENPWDMVFLPTGGILVTERTGALRLISSGKLVDTAIGGLPRIKQHGQGGLMGIALHPDFARNRLVYLSYAGRGRGGYSTEVLRARFDGANLHDIEIIFRARPKVRGGRHFGGCLLFDDQGYLFISLGERGEDDDAQDLSNHSGSLIRLQDDGSVPANNPFAELSDVAPGIYTRGNRNIQGLVLHPVTGEVWTHEHGPRGGDEVNIMHAGENYGWPVITYGRNYVIGTKIGEGTHKPGMVQPIYKWVPSIAPSGMAFYEGDKFPDWRGDLFVGSLKFGLLVRLEIKGNEIVTEERLLGGKYGRIRNVVEGPDGYIYLLTDQANGKLLRLMPNE